MEGGAIRHLLGPLHADERHQPSFLQLHIIDPQDAANAKRMEVFEKCDKDYIAVISSILESLNSYTSEFFNAKDQLEAAQERGIMHCMYLKIDRRGKSKVFAKPTANENVVGFLEDQGDSPRLPRLHLSHHPVSQLLETGS